MESEKVKEIKHRLKKEYFKLDKEYSDHLAYGGKADEREEKIYFLRDVIECIYELKSENERLKTSEFESYQELDNASAQIHSLEEHIANLENIGLNENITVAEYLQEMQRLKERIAELEEALLDMVVQFCQMGEEGFLKHAFMSAEEQAFDTLEIQYGEKVSDVYKRFFKRWGRENETT